MKQPLLLLLVKSSTQGRSHCRYYSLSVWCHLRHEVDTGHDHCYLDPGDSAWTTHMQWLKINHATDEQRFACPYYRNLLCCSTKITSTTGIPSLSVNSLLGTLLYLNVTHPSDHSHLHYLKCHLIFCWEKWDGNATDLKHILIKKNNSNYQPKVVYFTI